MFKSSYFAIATPFIISGYLNFKPQAYLPGDGGTGSTYVDRIFGDVDCSGTVDSRDNQDISKFVQHQTPLSRPSGCPTVGNFLKVGTTYLTWVI